eukprot:6478649-Amphidinium_carterae.2
MPGLPAFLAIFFRKVWDPSSLVQSLSVYLSGLRCSSAAIFSYTNQLRWNRNEEVGPPWRSSTWQSVSLHFTQLGAPGWPASPHKDKPGCPADLQTTSLAALVELGRPAQWPPHGKIYGGKLGHLSPARVCWNKSQWRSSKRSRKSSKHAA